MRNSYLICYDICDDKRLRKVFQVMRGYGDHLQYSVFECQLKESDLVRLRAERLVLLRRRWGWLTAATLANQLTAYLVFELSLRAPADDGAGSAR